MDIVIKLGGECPVAAGAQIPPGDTASVPSKQMVPHPFSAVKLFCTPHSGSSQTPPNKQKDNEENEVFSVSGFDIGDLSYDKNLVLAWRSISV